MTTKSNGIKFIERPMMIKARRSEGILPSIDARLLRVVITACSSYLGRFGSGLAVLITLPMARQDLPGELFGVWMMLSALLAFMGFADLGIGNGVLNRITRAQAADNRDDIRRTLATGYICTSGISATLLLIWFAWTRLAAEPTSVAGAITTTHKSEVLNALNAFAVVLAINIPASLVQRVQLGMQKGYWNGIAQFCSALVTLAAVPITLYYNGSVTWLVLSTLGVQACINTVNSIIWLCHYRLFSRSRWNHGWDTQTAVELLRSGMLFFLLQVAAALAFQSDAIVISQTLGQEAYGDFAVIQKLFLFVSMMLSSAMVGLWPAFGDALAKNDRPWMIKVLHRSVVIAAATSLVAVTIMTLAMPWFMTHWLHANLNPSWALIAALATWTVIDAVTAVLAAFMNAANILRSQLIFAIAMGSAAFAGKWLLTPILGSAGTVLSTIISYCLISIPAQTYIIRQTLKEKDQ